MDTAKLLDLAKACVLDAGKLLREGGDKLRVVHERIAHDVKLEADRAAERLIREKLEKTGIPIIGEEYGGNEELLLGDELYWAVDPLDGTVNYSVGIPFSCSCVGLWRGLKPVAGAVYDFWHDELFAGAEGVGASLNGKTICVPQGVTNKKEVMATILWYPFPSPQWIQNLSAQYRQPRIIGSCALLLSYLAAGRIGAFFEQVYIWDVAAPLAVLQAAGGVFEIKSLGGCRVEVAAAWNKKLLPRG